MHSNATTVIRSPPSPPSFIRLPLYGDPETAADDPFLDLALYQTHFEHSGDPQFIVEVTPDQRTRFRALNLAYEQATDLRTTALYGHEPCECLPPSAAAAIQASYDRCIRTGSTIRCEERLALPVGTRDWLTTLTPVRNRYGRIHLILGLARDITEQKRKNRQLEESRPLLQRIAEATPDVVYVYDLTTQDNLYISPRIRDLIGYEPEEVESCEGGNLVERLLHRDDRATLAEHLRRLKNLADGEVSTVKLRMLHRDGNYRSIISNESPFGRNADGSVTQVLGVAHDAASRCQAEEGLSSILDNMWDGYLTINNDYIVNDANSSACRWSGLKREQLIGRHYGDLGHNPAFKFVRQAMEERRHVRAELPSSYRTGRWVSLDAYPSDSGVMIFFRDMTDRKLRQVAIEETAALLQATIDELPAALAILDDAARILTVNRTWHKIGSLHGLEPSSQAVGENYLELFSKLTERVSAPVSASRQFNQLISGKRQHIRFDYKSTADRDQRHYTLTASRYTVGGEGRIVVVHRDITASVHIAEERQTWTTRALEMQVGERQRIARELHDSTAQHLAAVSLSLERLPHLADDPIARAVFGDIHRIVDEAQSEIRALSYLLHPPAVVKGGLYRALHRLLAGFSERTGLGISFAPRKERVELPTEYEIALFRIAQEALTNIYKHACATAAVVRLYQRRNRIILEIEDNGIGFQLRRGAVGDEQLGAGIPGMSARVSQLGGKLTVSKLQKGTLVKAAIPLGLR